LVRAALDHHREATALDQMGQAVQIPCSALLRLPEGEAAALTQTVPGFQAARAVVVLLRMATAAPALPGRGTAEDRAALIQMTAMIVLAVVAAQERQDNPTRQAVTAARACNRLSTVRQPIGRAVVVEQHTTEPRPAARAAQAAAAPAESQTHMAMLEP